MEMNPLRNLYNQETTRVKQQVRETASLYEVGTQSAGEGGVRYTFGRYGRRNWAVYDGDELVAVTVYKKGAKSVVDRLEAYELRVKANDSLEHHLEGNFTPNLKFSKAF